MKDIERWGENELSKALKAQFYIDLGAVFDTMEEYEEAIQCFDKAEEIHPENLNAWAFRISSEVDLKRKLKEQD